MIDYKELIMLMYRDDDEIKALLQSLNPDELRALIFVIDILKRVASEMESAAKAVQKSEELK